MKRKRADYKKFGASSDDIDQAVYKNSLQEMASALGEEYEDVEKASLEHETFDAEMEDLLYRLKDEDKKSDTFKDVVADIKKRHTNDDIKVKEVTKITPESIAKETDPERKAEQQRRKNEQDNAIQAYLDMKRDNPEELARLEIESESGRHK